MNKYTCDLAQRVCRQYRERRREIELGDRGRPRRAAVLAEYMRLNAAIDTALLIIKEESLREQIKRAIIDGAGFNSLYEHFCGYNQFYAYKRLVLTEVARLLNLAE